MNTLKIGTELNGGLCTVIAVKSAELSPADETAYEVKMANGVMMELVEYTPRNCCSRVKSNLDISDQEKFNNGLADLYNRHKNNLYEFKENNTVYLITRLTDGDVETTTWHDYYFLFLNIVNTVCVVYSFIHILLYMDGYFAFVANFDYRVLFIWCDIFLVQAFIWIGFCHFWIKARLKAKWILRRANTRMKKQQSENCIRLKISAIVHCLRALRRNLIIYAHHGL